MSQNDLHRRQIMFSSIKGKLSSANIMLDAAIDAADKGKRAHDSGHEDVAKDCSEAIFAAIEEVFQSISVVRALSIKSGSHNEIPKMPKYSTEVDNFNNNSS